jgi:hypothetical protein
VRGRGGRRGGSAPGPLTAWSPSPEHRLSATCTTAGLLAGAKKTARATTSSGGADDTGAPIWRPWRGKLPFSLLRFNLLP